MERVEGGDVIAETSSRATVNKPRATPPAPWPGRPCIFPRPDEAEVLAALEIYYRDGTGYAELGVIDGDPTTTRMRAPHDGKRWQMFTYTTPATRHQFAALYCDLVERYGNVYWSIGLYTRRDRDERYLLPLHVIFLDDPVRTLDELGSPALVLQTSPNSPQHAYALKTPLAANCYRAVSGPMKVAAGAGANSSNPLHMVRGPGSVNTKAKYGAPFVAQVKALAPDDTIDPDRALCVLGNLPSGTVSGAHTSETPRPIGLVGQGNEPWRDPMWRNELRNAADQVLPEVVPGRLLDDGGMPRGLKPHQVGYKILAARREKDEQGRPSPKITFTSPNGNWDASRERYNVIESLAYIGYNRAELAAFALKLADFGIEVKGSEAIWLDICRCIWLITMRTEDQEGRPVTPIYNPRRPEPTGDAPPVDLPSHPRARRRKGRPRKDRDEQAEKLFEIITHLPVDADGWPRTSRTALAAKMKRSAQMVGNYLSDLRKAGRIETRAEARNLAVRALINDTKHLDCEGANPPPAGLHPDAANGTTEIHGVHTPPPAPPEPVAEAPQAVPALPEEAAGASAAGVCPPCPKPSITPETPVEVIVERIIEAVAQVREEHATLKHHVDEETGEVTELTVLGKATRRRVAALLADVPPDLFDAAWKRYNDAWANERRRLWQLDDAGLAAAARVAIRKYAQAVKRNSSRTKYFATLAEITAEVCARRGVDPTVPARRKPRKCRTEARQEAQMRVAAVPAMLRLFEEDWGKDTVRVLPPPDYSTQPLPIASESIPFSEGYTVLSRGNGTYRWQGPDGAWGFALSEEDAWAKARCRAASAGSPGPGP